MSVIYKEKYKVIRELGSGGQGKVYLVEDLHIHKYWAMKLIEATGWNGKNRGIAELEIQAFRSLHHENLPLIVDLLYLEEGIGIVMEYIQGVNLQHFIEKNGPVPQEKVIQWGMELADVLEYLHTRRPAFFYGDMKPSNLILTDTGKLKLVDMGTVLRENQVHQFSSVGTYGYIPPEKERDHRSDIYSLGMTLHFLVTGSNPSVPGRKIRPIRAYDRTLSRGLEQIIDSCIAEEPWDRYQTCSALKKDLGNYKILEKKAVFEYNVSYLTYLLLTGSAVMIMGMELYRIANTGGDGNTGYLIYGILCAVTAYFIGKKYVHQELQAVHYYKQEISILKTQKPM